MTAAAGGLRLLYDHRDPCQVRAAALVHAVDVTERVTLVDTAAEGGPLRLVDADGTVRTGYDLFERLTRALPLLWPVAALTWLPGFPAFARWRYPGSVLPPAQSSPPPSPPA